MTSCSKFLCNATTYLPGYVCLNYFIRLYVHVPRVRLDEGCERTHKFRRGTDSVILVMENFVDTR